MARARLGLACLLALVSTRATAAQDGATLQLAPDDPVLVDVGGGRFDLDVDALARRHFAEATDAAELLFVATDFPTVADEAPFYVPVRNGIAGLGSALPDGPALFDWSADFGAPARLHGVIVFGQRWRCDGAYTQDCPAPTPPFSAAGGSRAWFFAQELGHRFGAYVTWRDPESGLVSDALLGRQRAHWSPWLHSGGSPLEGADLAPIGPARFERRPVTRTRFSPLELYLFGLLPPAEVPATFLLVNPIEAPDGTISGRPLPVRVEDVIAAEGPRSGDGGFVDAVIPVRFLLVSRGAPASAGDVAALATFRRHVAGVLLDALDGRARVRTAPDGADEHGRFLFAHEPQGFTGPRAPGGGLSLSPGLPQERAGLAVAAAEVHGVQLRGAATGGGGAELVVTLGLADGGEAKVTLLLPAHGGETVVEAPLALSSEVRSLRVESTRAATLVALSLLAPPGPDADADGVPDEADRCAGQDDARVVLREGACPIDGPIGSPDLPWGCAHGAGAPSLAGLGVLALALGRSARKRR